MATIANPVGDEQGAGSVIAGVSPATASLMDTAERPVGALDVLTSGLSASKALEAVATMAVNLQPGCRCGILLPGEEGFALVVDRGLSDEDRSALAGMADFTSLSELCDEGRRKGAEVRPLLTQSSECVGVIVVFQFTATAEERSVRQLNEICCVATLGIEQRNLLEELTYRAHHDSLTHLWNRDWMEGEIQRALDEASERNRWTGLVVIGIDSFSTFNEVLGRKAGDELLCLIASRIQQFVDPGLVLARSGGDEFTILLRNLHSEAPVGTLASQLRRWFDEPFQLGDNELVVRASFGTAASAPGECRAASLQNHADQALLFAKEAGSGRVAAYSPDMAKVPLERLVMERHLRFALERGELTLHYQPQVRLSSGSLLGVEALIRWMHPSLGMISPMAFVPLAEELGLIEEIGEWVLREAVRQLEEWNNLGLRHIRMAVNVSANQFRRPEFVEMLATLLENSRIQPQELELEITETVLMKDLEQGSRQLARLRALGIQVALDDFGTGHSSLAYLQHLPIDRLKIDRMFVRNISSADERPTLLSSIIQMGLAIGCEVIAEGVETTEQAIALSKMNCEEAQGFLFAKPLPPAELLGWAKAQSMKHTFDVPATPAATIS